MSLDIFPVQMSCLVHTFLYADLKIQTINEYYIHPLLSDKYYKFLVFKFFSCYHHFSEDFLVRIAMLFSSSQEWRYGFILVI